MAMSQTLIQSVGPLPLTAEFTALGDGPVLFYIAGSAYSTNAGNPLSIQLTMDGSVIGTISGYTNENESHKVMVPLLIPADMEGPNHSVTLDVVSANTVTDSNDYFQVVVMY